MPSLHYTLPQYRKRESRAAERKMCRETMKKEMKSINLTIFMMRVLGMWPASNARDKLRSDLSLRIMMVSMSSAVLIEAQDLFFSRKDILVSDERMECEAQVERATMCFQLLTYAAPCAVVVATEYWKLLVFVRNRQRVMQLNDLVEKSFWRIDYGREETELFNVRDRLCFKAILLFALLVLTICVHYIVAPAVVSIGKNASDRILPFPVYLDSRIYENPYYAIAYVFEFIGTMATCFCATTFASYFFAMNLSTATQLKLLQRELHNLCEKSQSEAHQKLKACIRRHQIMITYADQVEELFCFAMLGQMFGSVTQICFSGFQLILAEETTFQRKLLSVEYLLGSFVQLYFYCYSSHEIFTESQNVSEAAYSAKWYRITNPKLHKDFALMFEIMVHRARKPCILTVGKFCPLTLQTYSSVVRTSMSYFTVLRQAV
ncbi:odorant receptor 49b-like [Phymastichus coffea]|uniref:odorant receptor 49b-like n=1 Tax=Phymastichus coffea TaxID=108790 RepID=UPI00273AE574|nr:odorant receptor 49b-like [Phymastichus coffea]